MKEITDKGKLRRYYILLMNPIKKQEDDEKKNLERYRILLSDHLEGDTKVLKECISSHLGQEFVNFM